MLLTHDITNPGIAIGCLLALYQYQTPDEQVRAATHNNEVGFNAIDSDILSSFARQYIARGFLSEKQLALLRAKLPTYHRQLNERTIQPVRVIAAPTKPTPGGNKKALPINGGKQFRVTFSYDRELVERIKLLHGRRWGPVAKCWIINANSENIIRLQQLGFDIPGAPPPASATVSAAPTPPRPPLPPLDSRLYDFQRVGVQQIDTWGGRALLADEMGLGKTAQALAYINARRGECLPALVVCPATLKLNWRKECAMWAAGLSVRVIDGRTADTIPTEDVVIINYDVLSSWKEKLAVRGFKMMVADECHFLKKLYIRKNHNVQRTEAFVGLSKSIPRVLVLSGTPIINRPVEFFPTLNAIRPDMFPSFWSFAKKYCAAERTRWGWQFNGAENIEDLHKLLIDNVMIRRLKKDVLTDLPEKRRQVLPLELDTTTMAAYRRAENNIIAYIRDIAGNKAAEKASRAEALVEFEKCKQLAVEAKLPAAIEWIRDQLETNGKLVVMATHTAVIDRLMAELAQFNPVKVDGGVSGAARDAAVTRFQTDDSCRLFVGNIKAAGVGLTLTAASTIVFLEFAWTPGDHDQAEDRIHRIGQKDAALAIYMAAVGTIDETIMRLLDAKREVLTATLDGVEVDANSILIYLLAEFVR